jgi:hypothetical protein
MGYGKNVIGSTLSEMYAGRDDQKIFDYKGRLIQGGNIIFSTDGGLQAGYTENISVSTGFVLTPSSMTAYGVSIIEPSSGIPTSGVGRAYLAAPITGVEKNIILKSTAAGWLMDIDLSTNVSLQGTSGSFIGFSSLGSKYQAVSLIGMSTSEWAVKSVNSTVGGFDAANGIRQLTAVRTS